MDTDKYFLSTSVRNLVRLIEHRGGILLSTYEDTRDSLLIQCKYGHRFITRDQLIDQGRWCLVCQTIKPRDNDDMIIL